MSPSTGPLPAPRLAAPRPRHRGPRRRAIAIPFVLGFCFLAAVFVFMMSTIRVEDKRQNLLTFQQLKAYYMAQAAIQHALLKIRVLPNEVYDASALSRGYCPFVMNPPEDSAGNTVDNALDDFIEDITTDADDGYPPVLNHDPEQADWSYRIVSARALTTFTKADSGSGGSARKVNVLELRAEGTIQDKLRSDLGQSDPDRRRERTETIVKVVEITRQSM